MSLQAGVSQEKQGRSRRSQRKWKSELQEMLRKVARVLSIGNASYHFPVGRTVLLFCWSLQKLSIFVCNSGRSQCPSGKKNFSHGPSGTRTRYLYSSPSCLNCKLLFLPFIFINHCLNWLKVKNGLAINVGHKILNSLKTIWRNDLQNCPRESYKSW